MCNRENGEEQLSVSIGDNDSDISNTMTSSAAEPEVQEQEVQEAEPETRPKRLMGIFRCVGWGPGCSPLDGQTGRYHTGRNKYQSVSVLCSFCLFKFGEFTITKTFNPLEANSQISRLEDKTQNKSQFLSTKNP